MTPAFEARAAGSCRPPRRSRAVRPSTARATPVTSPRGFGDDAATRAARRVGRSRAAARWRESPSGTSGEEVEQPRLVYSIRPGLVHMSGPPSSTSPRSPVARASRPTRFGSGSSATACCGQCRRRRSAALQRDRRAAGRVAPRPDPRRLADRRGRTRARRGERRPHSTSPSELRNALIAVDRRRRPSRPSRRRSTRPSRCSRSSRRSPRYRRARAPLDRRRVASRRALRRPGAR